MEKKINTPNFVVLNLQSAQLDEVDIFYTTFKACIFCLKVLCQTKAHEDQQIFS